MSDRNSFATPLWRSLRQRNYRLYLTGQLVSVCGTWMQQVAQSWLVYRLTGSATLLGIVGFATQIPVFGLGPIAGVIIDRYSPHRVTVLTQSAALVQALLLSLLTLMGWVQPAHIILLGFVLGIVNAFDMPARQALVNQMVDAKDLSNAVALNSSMINALLAMKLPKKSDESARQFSIAHSLVEGLRYTLATVPIRDVLLLLGLVGFMGMPYMTLMPVFAAEIHKSGADALGLMLGAVGFGALIGALFLAQRATVLGLGRIIVIATLGFGLGLIVFTISHIF